MNSQQKSRPLELSKWPRERTKFRVFSRLASADRGSEDVSVLAIVIPELEFRNIERHVLATYFMKRPHDAALEDRPEAVNRIRVNRTDNILLGGMVYGAMRGVSQAVVDVALIGREQADLCETISRTKLLAAF